MPEIHRKWGGSTADRTLACPGWVAACKGLPKPPTSPYAQRGTDLHDIQEQLVINEQTPDDISFAELPDDYEEATHTAFDMAERMMDKFQCEYVETEVFLDGPLPDTGGSMDLTTWGDQYFVVGDYKFGSVLVSANLNAQGLFYLWLLWCDAMWRERMEGKTLVFAIIQPGQSDFSYWVLPEGALGDFDKKFNDAYAKAQGNKPPLSAGNHCKYCVARATCPEQRRYATRALTLDPVNKASIVEALSMAKQLESWCKEVFAAAQQYQEMGEQIPGWKLVEKRAVRKWDDEDAVVTGLYRALNRDQYFTEKLMTPAQMDKLKKVPPAKRKLFEKHTVKKSSGVTIAPESDKRPAVTNEVPDALKNLVGEKK